MNFIIWVKEALVLFVISFFRSYYEANDVTSAINIIEEAFSKHQGLVSMEDVNIAAELYISNKQYDKALEVGTFVFLFRFEAHFCVLETLTNWQFLIFVIYIVRTKLYKVCLETFLDSMWIPYEI